MRAAFALLALGAMAACGSKEAKQPQGASFGQVLPGSASDAMPPYDTVTSAPPIEAPSYDGPERNAEDSPEGAASDGSAAEDTGTSPDPTAT